MPPSRSPLSRTANDTYIQANRTLWDAWTRLHLQPGIYGVEDFKAGRTTLKALELEELGDVSGKTLLHLQCHIGLDTLSWARLGARVTGVDLSPESVAAARALGTEMDLSARFVCSDLYRLSDAPELAGERFDVVFTSYGTLSWLPDVTRWAQVIARFLRPGGTFYIVDRHPFVRLLAPRQTDNRGHPLYQGYFFRPEPARSEEHGSYADPEAEVWTTAYYWMHTLGDVVTALSDAGLRLDFLHEHPPAGDDPSRLAVDEAQRSSYPAWFSIRATAPPPGPS